MDFFRSPYFITLLVLVVPTFTAPPPSENDASVKQAANANTRFAFDLLKSLMQTEGSGKNIFFSPYSISAALAMTSLGAAGNTLAEIDQTFHFNDVNTNGDKMKIHELYKQLIDLYNSGNSNYSLSTANRLFGHNNFEVLQSFQDNAKKYYNAELEQLDFKSGKAEGVINQWVEQETHNKIKDLIAAGSLQDAVMVLVNAIYFKGTWKTQFDAKDTKEEDFHLNSNDKKKVKMMKLTSQFNYYHDNDLKAKVLEMPYTGDHLSMIIVLPDEVEGLAAVTQKLTDSTFNNMFQNLVRQKVVVSFPKFKLETEYSLKDTLATLGIHDLFSNSASLSSLSEVSVKISKIVHKAFVETDEQGTEAAATTSGQLIPYSLPPPAPIFNADRPFLFSIIHREAPFVIFNGYLVNPNKMNEISVATNKIDSSTSDASATLCTIWLFFVVFPWFCVL